MEEIKKQVSRARRRLITDQFIMVFSWAMFLALVASGIAISLPKIFVFQFAGPLWTNGWLIGGLAGGLLSAVVWTYLVRRNDLDAAYEIDHRFGLKERVTSSLSLDPEQRDSEVARALLDDTQRRVAMIDIREKFRIQPSWRPVLPVLAGVAVFLLAFLVQDAQQEQIKASTAARTEVKKQIQNTAEQLRKQLERKKAEAAERGLKEAESVFEKLQRGVDELSKRNDVDRKQALVEMNDLSKELAERRKQLEGIDEMKKQLDQLKNMEQGPADKMARAMRNGDFNKALDEIQKLQEKLKEGDLSDAEKQQLAKQLSDLQKKLEDMAAAAEQAKRDLQDQIEKKRQAGDLAGANELQKKLDKLNSADQQMSQMQNMASQLGQCAECLQKGDQKGAAQSLDKMAENLQNLQTQLDELATLNEAMDAIMDAKAELSEGGMGDGMDMQGMGMEGNLANRFGQGSGEGQGIGDRPEEETDTGSYESKVGAQPGKGEAVRVGDAFGPNMAGKSREQIKDELQSEFAEEADPIINQRLPRREQRHAAEYLERLRTGDGAP